MFAVRYGNEGSSTQVTHNCTRRPGALGQQSATDERHLLATLCVLRGTEAALRGKARRDGGVAHRAPQDAVPRAFQHTTGIN